jgi:alanyl-tRNA synthetase
VRDASRRDHAVPGHVGFRIRWPHLYLVELCHDRTEPSAMNSSEVRQKFLDYFARHGHVRHASSGLVPGDDPTLLFTNAGMVQFKRYFLGEEKPPFARAVTSQKCLRVSGKHNDLEEVGVTRRHHTFFEMLGNFSFGDYFKRDAIRFAWELFTEEYGIPKERLWATVHYTDDEAAALWEAVAGLPPSRIFRLGDQDNFWQMGDTGPCGPCSEIHYDLREGPARGTDVTQEEFERLGEAGEFLELWNLVFMQYDRSADGTLTPLPAPSIDTGAGLERVASVLQGVDSNYKTDLFMPLIERAAEIVGEPYDDASSRAVSFRVLADHARAVAFLLADGVFASNEGRGYVLRRVLRRAVRHAWLLGRREPTLHHVVDRVVDIMGEAYPDLVARRDHLVRATLEEEERFLATIGAGLDRFDEIAPADAPAGGPRVVSGADAFRLYDTFGFPIDLTEIIAAERGYAVDGAGFDAALEEQRERSREDRRQSGGASEDALAAGWETISEDEAQEFVGYDALEVETEVIALRRENGRVALQLRRTPFYVEAGGQVSDHGVVEGDGWRVEVDGARRIGGRSAVLGSVEGELPPLEAPLRVRASVLGGARRDTQRNHTATHLLHAALREALGTHVVQRGSLVAPDRLRFDFSHPRPMTPEQVRHVEEAVNRAILDDYPVAIEQRPYREAVAAGAMALFGEKYGDVVRVVTVPGVSVELCGGTHVRHTGEIGLFRIVQETGVAAGVRRVEAVTGHAAYRRAVEQESLIQSLAAALKTVPDQLERRVEQVQEELRSLRRELERARQAGAGDVVGALLDGAARVGEARVVATRVDAETGDALRGIGDRLRERLGSGAAVLAAKTGERTALMAVVTDDLIGRGVRADRLVREVATATGGTGGGRPHMAQGGVGDDAQLDAALARVAALVGELQDGDA